MSWGPPERFANLMWNGIFCSSPEAWSATCVTGSPIASVVSAGTVEDTGLSRATVGAVPELPPRAVATQARTAISADAPQVRSCRVWRPVRPEEVGGGVWCMRGPFRVGSPTPLLPGPGRWARGEGAVWGG